MNKLKYVEGLVPKWLEKAPILSRSKVAFKGMHSKYTIFFGKMD